MSTEAEKGTMFVHIMVNGVTAEYAKHFETSSQDARTKLWMLYEGAPHRSTT